MEAMEKRNQSLATGGNRTPAVQPVTLPTELSNYSDNLIRRTTSVHDGLWTVNVVLC
jgi:hypothetical protein